MWVLAGYADHLADRRRLLVDHRGHGRSDRPRRREDHRMEEYVADVVAVPTPAASSERPSSGTPVGRASCIAWPQPTRSAARLS
ncbi:MAG: hypothetical protein ACYCUG_05290 [Acidimicrobiales bacterium]